MTAPALRPATVLIVEPRPAMRRMMVARLEAEDHRVIGAGDLGQAAEDMHLLGPVDCLVAPAAAVETAEPGLAAVLAQRLPEIGLLLIADRGEARDVRANAPAAALVDALDRPFAADELARRVSALVRPG